MLYYHRRYKYITSPTITINMTTKKTKNKTQIKPIKTEKSDDCVVDEYHLKPIKVKARDDCIEYLFRFELKNKYDVNIFLYNNGTWRNKSISQSKHAPDKVSVERINDLRVWVNNEVTVINNCHATICCERVIPDGDDKVRCYGCFSLSVQIDHAKKKDGKETYRFPIEGVNTHIKHNGKYHNDPMEMVDGVLSVKYATMVDVGFEGRLLSRVAELTKANLKNVTIETDNYKMVDDETILAKNVKSLEVEHAE